MPGLEPNVDWEDDPTHFPAPHTFEKPVMSTEDSCATCGLSLATPCHSPDGRCTIRKHVAEIGRFSCDCGAMTVGKTAAGNAYVVTTL